MDYNEQVVLEKEHTFRHMGCVGVSVVATATTVVFTKLRDVREILARVDSSVVAWSFNSLFSSILTPRMRQTLNFLYLKYILTTDNAVYYFGITSLAI